MAGYEIDFSMETVFPSNLSGIASESSLFENIYDDNNHSRGNLDIDIPGFWELATFDNLRQSLPWSIALILAYVVVFISGNIGNILVAIVIVVKPPMHPVTNIFLLNLAVADLLVSLFCVPATLISNLFIPWILGSFMCKAAAYVQGVSVCASAYSLVALSLDRCKAICRPIERHQGQGITKYQAWAAVALIWIFSLLITLPWLFVFEVKKEDEHIFCLEIWENAFVGKIYFVVAHLICCYIIPFLIVLASNLAISHSLSKRPPPPKPVSTTKGSPQRARYGVRRTLGFVTAAFLISWLPLYVIVTLMKFSSKARISEWEDVLAVVVPIAQWLGTLNSCMNPVLYAFTNAGFRKGFYSLLTPFNREQRV